MQNKTMKGNLYLLSTAVIWGLAIVAQRIGGETLGAFSFNSIRFALGGVSLFPLVILLNDKSSSISLTRKIRYVLPYGVIAGSILFLAASLQQYGIIYTSVGNTAFITCFYIILVPFFGLFLKQRINGQIWVAALIAVIGLYFLTIKEGFSVNYGDYFQLAGAVFWALHILAIDHFAKRCDILKLSLVQFFACSALSGIVALFAEETTLQMVINTRWPLLYGSVLSVGVAYTFQALGQRHAKPSHAAIILSMETVVAALGGTVLLGEVLTTRGYFGAALMFFGVIISQVRLPASGDLKRKAA